MTDPWEDITSTAATLERAARFNHRRVERDTFFGFDSFVCQPAPAGLTTKIHFFMVVGVFPPGWANRERVDGFAKRAVDYSIRMKTGLPRGAQTGTATIAVVVTDQLMPDAEDWATKIRQSRFAAVGYPVTVETSRARIVRPQRMIIGAAYSKILKRFVQENITDVLIPPTVR